MSGEMKDGIRKIRQARESKRKGYDVYAYKVPYRDANGRQRSETFHNLETARAFRNEIRSSQDRGVVADPKAGKISFGEYAAEWLENKRLYRQEGTYRNYEAYLRHHVLPELSGYRLSAVTRGDIQRWVNRLSVTLAPRSVRSVYIIAAMVFRSAVLDRRIPESPCVAIGLPRVSDDEAEPLTVAQVRTLAGAIHPRYRALVLLAASTGLRFSEAVGLTWDRIDLEAGTLTVDRQLIRRKFTTVKSRAGKRTIPLASSIVAELRRHRDTYPPKALSVPWAGSNKTVDAELVFTSVQGRIPGEAAVRGHWNRARDAASMSHVRFHQLRHTYASLLIDAGENPKVIQKRLGHASIQVTMDVYGHLYPESDNRTRAIIDNVFAETNETKTSDGPSSETA